MNLLITGATGFLGSHLLEHFTLTYPDWNVVGTGRNEDRISFLSSKGLKLIQGDLADNNFVKSNFKNITHIIHCAALSAPWGRRNDFYSANCAATKNLLVNIDHAAMFVHISSASIYFDYTNRLGITENDPLAKNFVNDYALTKYMSEQIVLAHENQGTQRIILRPRAIIGAGDTVILPRVIRAYLSGRLKIIGNGTNICDFTSIKNLITAVELSLKADGLDKEIFNITDGEPQSLWEMLNLALVKLGYDPHLRKVPYPLAYFVAYLNELRSNLIVGKEPILTRYGIGILKYSLTLDIQKAKSKLNYSPVTTTEESINEFAESYGS